MSNDLNDPTVPYVADKQTSGSLSGATYWVRVGRLHISIYEKIWKKILIHFPNKYSHIVKKKKENHFPAHLWIPGVCVRAFWFDWSTVTGWFTALGAVVGGVEEGEVFAVWRVPSWESSWNKGEGVWQLSPSYCTAFVITTTEHTSRLGP